MPIILIVESDQPTRQEYIQLFNANGYETIEAENGVVGLEYLETKDIDLVITAWQLPGIDGLDMIRRYKNSIFTDELPVILISGYISENTPLLWAAQILTDEVFFKPVAQDILLSAVKHLIEEYAE